MSNTKRMPPGLPPKSEAIQIGMKVELRDWLAGHAMAGLLTCVSPNLHAPTLAKIAYECADAMLKARSQDDR